MDIFYDMKEIKDILKSEFNIQDAIISHLYGYDNSNYLVKSSDQKFVLKQYKDEPGLLEILSAENRILNLFAKELPGLFQKPVGRLTGGFIHIQEFKGNVSLFRLLHYIEGELMADVDHTDEMYRSFGKVLAKMDLALLPLRDIAIEARRYEWDIVEIDLTGNLSGFIKNPAYRSLVEYFYQQFNEHVRPELPGLRKSIIHADANDRNVIIENGKVAGIIDFGDLVYSPLINELAVAFSYALYKKDNPLEWAVPIMESYCSVLPLEEKEVDILYYLIAARLCISVRKSAHLKTLYPDDEYYVISEQPSWDLLRKWISISPFKAQEAFRKAAGFESKITDTSETDLIKRDKYLCKALSVSYSKPIKMERAAFQYMYDNLGNTYLDARNNIPHVGHCHPRVVEAGQRQIAVLNTNTRYLYDEINDYSELILKKFPDQLNKIFYVNSGSAASDLAVRLALSHTSKDRLVVMEEGYHGNTRMGIDISHYKYGGSGGRGKPDNVIMAPLPGFMNGIYRKEAGVSGEEYARLLISRLEAVKEGTAAAVAVAAAAAAAAAGTGGAAGSIAAFISEPVIGCAGQVSLPKGYLNTLYPYIREQGGVCISDEVQTGFGRLGNYFWGYEMYDVVPDIVILGKPIANGHPMAAVITTTEIAESFDNGMEFFSSFGGNPVSCAIASAVLKVIEEEDLQQNTKTIGDYLISEFINLQKKYPCIGDIRGSGLFLGLEFMEPGNPAIPATQLTDKIKNELRERFILVGTDGPHDNVLKIKPPLCFTNQNADYFVKQLDEILQTLMQCEVSPRSEATG